MRFAILLLPLLELFTLVELGIRTSALTVLLYVITTFLVGLVILQRQGRGLFERLRQGSDGRIISPEWFVDGIAMGVAGLLLMIPGIITDLAALILMIGPLRRRLARVLWGSTFEVSTPERQGHRGETIEGVFWHREDDEHP